MHHFPARMEQISAERYHADPCEVPSLSASIAHLLISRSPAHAYEAHPRLGGHPAEPTDATDRGALIHRLVLGTGADIVPVDAEDWRTKAAREQRDAIRAAGQIPVLANALDDARNIAEGIVARLAEQGIRLDGMSERMVTWTETAMDGSPVACRGMLDHWDPALVRVLDLKTCRSAHPKACAAHAIAYGADIQVAAYRSALEHLDPRYNGRVKVLLAFAEMSPPWPLTVCEPAGTLRQLGQQRWRRAIDLWSDCRRLGRWPAYAQSVVPLEAPPWAIADDVCAAIPAADPTEAFVHSMSVNNVKG